MSLAASCVAWRPHHDQRPRATLKVQDRPCQALFDSGSDVTCLAFREYCQLKDRPNLLPYENHLTAANGQALQVMGRAKLRYEIGGRLLEWDTTIVRNLKSDLIVGVDLMRRHNVTINMGSRVISVPKSESGSPASSINFDPSVGQSAGEYKVNPYEAAQIEVNTVEAPGTLLLAKGPYIDEGVCEVNHLGRASLMLTNRTCDTITIRGKTPLCRMEAISRESCDGPLTEQRKKTPHSVNTLRSDQIPAHLNDRVLAPLLENIPREYHARFSYVLRKHSAAFCRTDDEIGKCTAVKQKIELLDPRMVSARPPYRIPEALRPVADEYVQKLLKQGVIRPSRSPWSAPLLLVKKPGVTDPSLPLFRRYRACVDYRMLNLNVKKDRFPLSDCDHLIDFVSSGKVISKIDIQSGFFNQALEDDSMEYTAFSVGGMGHYEFTRSPMGICNSPSAFTRLVSYILREIKNVEFFVDDLCLVNQDYESHLKTLEEVLQRFCQYGLKIRVDKLQLAVEEVEFLGYQISSRKGVRPGLAKTQAIRDWKPPKDVKEIKQFIGLCSYFRRVVKDFSIIAKPLTVLTRKDSKYQKGDLPEPALRAFQKLRQILSTRPVLAAVNNDHQFVLITDASNIGAGCVLAQRDPDGIERPVAYASKTWSESEARRATFHLEAQALLFGARRFRHYLVGRPVIFRTDHRPLVSLDRTSSPVLDRIYAELEEYSFTMEHLSGDRMPADGLSRSALHAIQAQAAPAAQPGLTTGTQEKNENKGLDTFPYKGLSTERLKISQQSDRWIKALACKLRYDRDPDAPHLREWVEQHLSKAEICEGIVGLRQGEDFRILAPLNLRDTLLSISHDDPLGGHQGPLKTYGRLRTSWYWPKMREDIENYAKSCRTCAENNVPNFYTKMALRPLPEAKYVGDRVHIDLIGPYPADPFNNRYALVMVDAFSNFVRVAPQPTKETEVTALSFLNHWVCNHSVPTRIQSDHGGEFASKVMRHLDEKLGIYRHVWSSAYHPASNAKVERANRQIVSHIRKFIEGNGDKWSELIPSMVFSLNTGLHEGKLMSAHQMVYGSRPTLPVDVLNPRHNYSEVPFEQMLQRHHKIQDDARDRQKAAFAKQKRAFDKTCRERVFLPGMIVYVSRPKSGHRFQKFQPLFFGPHIISEALGNDNFLVRHSETGKKSVVHANRLKYGTAREQIIRHIDPDLIQEGERGEEDEALSDDAEVRPPSPQRSDEPSPPLLAPDAPPSPPPLRRSSRLRARTEA